MAGEPDNATTNATAQPAPEAILPDSESTQTVVEKPAVETEKLAEYEKTIQQLKSEKEVAEKRMRDAQDHLHSMTNAGLQHAKADDAPKQKSITDYVAEIKKIHSDDPTAAIEKIVMDVAHDRMLMEQQYERKLAETAQMAVRSAMSVDPDKAKLLQQVQELDDNRPDLANLTFNQKFEYVQMMNKIKGEKEDTGAKPNAQQYRIDRSMLDMGTRTPQRQSKFPEWVDDPVVQREAKGMFSSKEELLNWKNPETANRLAQEIARKKRSA